MGVISTGLAFLGRVGSSVLGIAPKAAPLAAAVAGGAAFQGGVNLLTGDDNGNGAVGLGGQFIALADGSRVLLSSTGRPVRPQFFLPIGARMPAGSRVVAISPNGLLIGIRKRAKRRTFRGEVSRTKSVVKNCKSLLKALK